MWKENRLSEIISLQRGHDLPETKRNAGNIPVMGSFGQTGWHSEAKASSGGVCIGRSGSSFGKVSFCQEAYWPLNTVLYVTDFKGNDPRFIYYLLKTIDFSAFNSGSAQPSLNRNYIGRLKLQIPGHGVQKRIASILGNLDKKIELNLQTARTLEELAQRLFKSWFVDFDPVHTKMAGRQPAHMSPETAALFPDKLVDSSYGQIPEGWAVTEVEKVCAKIINGGTPKRKESAYWHPPMHSWFKTGELHDTWLVNSSERLSDEGLQNSAAKLCPRGTVLIAIYAAPTVGRLGVLSGPGAFNQACTALIPQDGISPWFIFWNMYFMRSELNNISTGAAQQNISKAIVAQQKIIHPNFNIHQAFNELIDPLHERVLSLHRENLTLVQLRDGLLPRLTSGDIRVPEAQEITEEA